MRNQATDAADSFAANQIGDKTDFRWALEKQSNNQHDCQRYECMQVEQWHGCVNRKLHPPGQGTFAVALGDRGRQLGTICLRRNWSGYIISITPAGVVGHGCRGWAEESFSP